MAMGKIVVNDWLVAACQQLRDDHATDITRTTRNQDPFPHEVAGLSVLSLSVKLRQLVERGHCNMRAHSARFSVRKRFPQNKVCAAGQNERAEKRCRKRKRR